MTDFNQHISNLFGNSDSSEDEVELDHQVKSAVDAPSTEIRLTGIEYRID